MEKLPEGAKALLWTLHHLESLIDQGLVNGPKMLNPEKSEEVKALIDSGYRPTDEEIHDWMALLMSGKVQDFLESECSRV